MTIFYLALLILTALFASKLLSYLKLPDVTGYLLAGIIIGPSVLGLIPESSFANLNILNSIALAFIAYNIGCEMDFQSIKELGNNILIITAVQAIMTMGFVFITFMIMGQGLAFSLVVAAIACATAPAATLMVIQQYRAKGQLVDTLIPVVALDDAFTIMVFGIANTVALNLLSNAEASIVTMLFVPLWEIALSLIIGILGAIIAILILQRLKSESDVIIFIIGGVLLLTFVSEYLNISSLLTIMAFGVMVGNFSSKKRTARTALEGISLPVFVAFFALSGAELDLKVLSTAGLLSLAYFLSRAAGKIYGSRVGAQMTKMPEPIVKYLGLTLVPQAGVAIGLSQIASQTLPEPLASTIQAVVLGAVIANEIVGPVLAKYALTKAGEIAPENL
ncbi:MAG: cation:proton antiporter [Clostridium sp.]|jgi:Kef-type K+ transport system membrane component KefB|nr:cation:proton antiporter [Clostridium sp.]